MKSIPPATPSQVPRSIFFFLNDTATPETSPLPLHDALPISFKVGALESVVVPAGTFQAYRIAVTGSRVPFTVYVSAAAPRRVVKTEYLGQPLIVELVK